MDIKDLKDGMKKVNVTAKIVDKGATREIRSKFKDETYTLCDTILADDTGTIKLTLWEQQTYEVNIGDTVKIENGYVTSFKGEIQLNVGKFGELVVG